MGEPKFTPGPWVETLETRSCDICTIYSVSPRSTPEPEAQCWLYIIAPESLYRDEQEQDANARLIAAAPDLYEALAEMVSTYREGGPDDSEPSMVRAALAALAKARGEG